MRGTATYAGSAAGLYGYRYGRSHSGVPNGTHAIGEYAGEASLTANFAARTISGCIGCSGDVIVSGIAVTPSGETVSFNDQTSAKVLLGAASFDSGGVFRSRNVAVQLLGRTVTQTSGSWGGRFSTIDDFAGYPRSVAGTTGAEWNESDGSKGVLVGAWLGLAE